MSWAERVRTTGIDCQRAFEELWLWAERLGVGVDPPPADMPWVTGPGGFCCAKSLLPGDGATVVAFSCRRGRRLLDLQVLVG